MALSFEEWKKHEAPKIKSNKYDTNKGKFIDPETQAEYDNYMAKGKEMYDQYTNSKPKDKFEGLRIKPKDKFEGLRIKPKEDEFESTNAPDLYYTHPSTDWIHPDGTNRTAPLEEFKEIWRKRGKNPEERLAVLDDKFEYTDKKGRKGYKHYPHLSTWGDRGKELLQGVGSGLATIPDLASNYVAAPITFLGSKYAKGHGKLLNSIGAESLGKYANNVGEDLQNLSNKYWNQNLSHEIKNSKELATKNRDDTAAMLRGAGEFATDLIPANAIGTGAKYLARGAKVASKVASPAVKGLRNKVAQWWKEPKLPKVANLLETPITGKNVAGFAGAGAGHGFVNTDAWGDKKPSQGVLYDIAGDLPSMAIGASVGQGIYGGIKGAANGVRSGFKAITNKNPNGLSLTENWLAKRINKGNNELDENFINLAKDSDLDLNAFNIYKNNKMPFKIARRNPVEEYLEILPKMKKNIHDKTIDLLDNSYVPYNENNPKSDLSHSANLISAKLKDQFKKLEDKSTLRYDMSDMYASPDDYVNLKETIPILQDLYHKTLTPVKKGSGIGELNNITMELLGKLYPDRSKLQLNQLLNQKRGLQQIVRSAPAKIGSLKTREIKLLQQVIDAIDTDINKNAHITNEKFLPSRKQADRFYAEHIAPFKTNKTFKRLSEDLNIEKAIIDIASDKNKSAELQKILNINEIQDKAYYSPSRAVMRDLITEFNIKPKTDEDYKKLGELVVKKFKIDSKGKGKGKGKGLSEILEHDRNYIDDTKLTLDWVKRLETEKRLIGDKYKGEYKIGQLLEEINASRFSDLYKPELSKSLDKKIKPYAKKYLELTQRDKESKSGLTNTVFNSDHYHNKYDIMKHIHHWPTLVSGAVGAQLGGYVGGLAGFTAGGLAKHGYSKKIFNTMTNKQFVDELIRLGRIPKTEKQRLTKELSSNPVLKTELINILFKKDDEKNN